MTERTAGMFDCSPVRKFPLYLRSVISGERCSLCREENTEGMSIICPRCREALEKEAGAVCVRCGALVSDCLCVTGGMKAAGISAFIKLFPYYTDGERVSNRLLYRLKSVKDRQLSALVASELAPRCVPLISAGRYDFADVCVTYVPRSGKRIRENGTDQAKELASALADALGVKALPLLHRESRGNIQKKLGNDGRESNVEGMFSLKDEAPACVILIDDLVTTGSTVCACASALHEGGAACVICAAVAHTVGHGTDYVLRE